MIFKQNINSLNKYTLICNLVNDKNLNKLFKEYDKKLLKKRFDDVYELTVNENILTINAASLKTKEIKEILLNFINKGDIDNFIKNRALYEFVKITNIPNLKIEKILSKEELKSLYDKINDFLKKNSYMSVDFLILRCADNFVIKTKDLEIKKDYKLVVRNTLQKMINNNYIKETKESTSSVLCWFDRIVCAAINLDINLNEFIVINKKILNTSFLHIDILLKCLNIINYLLCCDGFNDSIKLRKFKREILKKINNYYTNKFIDQEKALQTEISVLSKQITYKEDFYHLFNIIKNLAEKNDENKIFAINLCEYIVYIDGKQNIFCYRFIRENFISLLKQIIKKEDIVSVKEKELHLLINIFYNSPFFVIHKKEVYQIILSILINFPENKSKAEQRLFYKYCDILDYTLANNKDLYSDDFFDKLANNPENKNLIKKRFCLLFKNAV